jgi:hypothetical protein
MTTFTFKKAPAPATVELSADDLRFLDAVGYGGVTRGSTAMRRAKFSAEQFLEAAKKLSEASLINIAGDVSDGLQAQYAMFSLNPNTVARFQRDNQFPGVSVAIK